MPASVVSICNRALQILGAGPILSIDDDNERARAMRVAYEPVRDAELRRRRWRFSILRESLAALADAPDSDYSYQYPLPNNLLRLIEGGDIRSLVDLNDYRAGAAPYSLEGRRILTNLTAPLAIRFIGRITDVSLYDSAFCEALSARMAYEACERLTESNSKEEAALKRYSIAIREATQANALERPSEVIGDGEWVMARQQ